MLIVYLTKYYAMNKFIINDFIKDFDAFLKVFS